MVTKNCKNCKKEFINAKDIQEFCCDNCKQKYYYLNHRKERINKQLEYYNKNKDKISKYQIERIENIRKNETDPRNKIYTIRHKLTPKIKKIKCEICGDTKNLSRHHWRYDKPKLISVLCKECHNAQHHKK